MDTPSCKRKSTSPPESRLEQYKTVPIDPHKPNDKLGDGLRHKLTPLYQIGQDWLYLALLGATMAVLSFSMDQVINLFLNTRLWMFEDLAESNIIARYLAWSTIPLVLVIFSTGFVHLCSPTAVGSGIPEMKTILRGVVLNEYLTFRTLIAKIVGLMCTLGSGLPLGKEGPFVHMASIVATLLSKLMASFTGFYENESRTSEMLSAACAVGVAATFYAPIGGVLFSIEVTTVYFAVRSYWRGFFAACCGALIWRLLGFWIKNDESITALFKTNFRDEYPFDPVELFVFSFIGATCGLAGAAYIKFHREIVQFFRRHKRLSDFFQQNRFVYPALVTLTITTVNFQPLLGKYTASKLSTHTTIEHLFSNRTWSLGEQDLTSKVILDTWTTPNTNFQLHLALYIITLFWTSALASTIPIPSGIFIPVLKMGAAYGRLLGELMHLAFPNGIRYRENSIPAYIIPGSYAVVGAAAFSGAVTHTISTSVILFEMTGQIVHIIPVILGVLIANAVCQSLQPSIYDSIIEIKKLPYLPPIASSNSVSHKILVKDFMIRSELAYLWKDRCTYANLMSLLVKHPKIVSFPLVESQKSMKLLGSIARPDLLKLLYMHLGRERRLQVIQRRISNTIQPPFNKLDIPSINIDSTRLECHSKTHLPDSSLSPSSNSLDTSSVSSVDISGRNSCSGSSSGNEGSTDNSVLETKKRDIKIFYGKNIQIKRTNKKRKASLTNYDGSLSTYRKRQRKNWNQEMLARLSGMKQDADGEDLVKQTSSEPHNDTSIDESIPVSENRQARQPGSRYPSITRPLSAVIEMQLTNNFSESSNSNQPYTLKPTKSILKTSNSTSSFTNLYQRNISNYGFTKSLSSNDQMMEKQTSANPTRSNYGRFSTVCGKSNIPIIKLDDENCSPKSKNHNRRVRLPHLRVVDMTAEEQEQWEMEQLRVTLDLSKCQIDEAPFQLVEQTSLYRIHTLFSILGLNHAYVTSFGKLVGVVALKDIRFAIEGMLQNDPT